MIELRDVIKDYKTSTGKSSRALNKINMKFNNLGLVSILGNSGSGKTSLLNIIAGIIKPTSGNVIYDSLNSDYMSDSDYDYLRNYYFGFIFQEIYLIETLTVYENIEISLRLQGLSSEQIEKIILETLRKLNIVDYINKKVSELSGGEKQRVCIARSIAKGCKVLLADEPAASLDVDNSKIVYDCLKKISKDILVIMVTHDEVNAQLISDNIIRIDKGDIISNVIDNEHLNIMTLPTKKKTNNLLLTYKLSRFINRKQWFRYFFTLLFWIICMMIVILSLNFSTFNTENFIYSTAKENNITGFKIVDNLFSLDENNFNYDIIDKSKYQSVNFFDYYNTDEVLYTEFNKKNEDIIYQDYYGDFVFNTIIIKDIANNNIEITDFIASMLIDYGIIEANNLSNCINKEIKYKDVTLIISSVINTDYEMYNKDITKLDSDSKYDFLEKRKNEYTTVFMNKYTMDLLVKTKLDFDAEINNKNVNIMDYRLIDDTSSIALFGNLPSSNNEIVVSLSFLYNILSISNLDQSELNSHINKTYTINVSSNDISRQFTYKIVGIVYNDFNLLYLNSDEFIILSQNFEVNMGNTSKKQIYFELGNKEDTINLIRDVLNHDGYLLSKLSKDIFYTYTGMLSYKRIAKVSTTISIVILILILIYFTNNLIRQNKRNIGVLSSIGFSKKDIVSIFIWENIKILMISFMCIIIFDYIALILINQNIKSLLNISINVLNFNIYNLFIILLLSSVIVFISSLYPIYMMRKKDLIDIIYDK